MTYILVVVWHIYMCGNAFAFQEFNTKTQCEYAASIMRKQQADIAYCLQK